MLKTLSTFLLAGFASLAMAQTQLRITDLTITEREDIRRGGEVTASLRGTQGKRPVLLYADQRFTLDGKFKVKTHNVRRQSVKQGAVYLTMNMRLKVDGKRNKRISQKTFYAEQDRSATFKEDFLIKRGIDVRKISVAFVGAIE